MNLRISRAKEQERELKEKREQESIARTAKASVLAAAAMGQKDSAESVTTKLAQSQERTFTVSDINQMLAPLSVSDHVLSRFGFCADSYTKEQFLAICEALIKHIKSCY